LACLEAEARHVQAGAEAHLWQREPVEAIEARLQARTACQVEERRFDPLLAEVFNRVIDRGPVLEIAERTRRYNGFPIERVTECGPAREALPMDVADPAAELRRIGALAALLERDLSPLKLRKEEAAGHLVVEIDALIHVSRFRSRNGDSFVDRELVPHLGAWLGERLVSELGGRWVPRSSLSESHVVIGDWSWRPFERARGACVGGDEGLRRAVTLFWLAASGEARLRPLEPG
jgi:hypothetical protein